MKYMCRTALPLSGRAKGSSPSGAKSSTALDFHAPKAVPFYPVKRGTRWGEAYEKLACIRCPAA